MTAMLTDFQVNVVSLPLRCHGGGRSGVLQGARGYSVNFEWRVPIAVPRVASDAILVRLEGAQPEESSEVKSRPLKAETPVQIPLEPHLS
jgi:hypothetical protein